MKILVLNCGSSSIKFQFLSMTTEKIICKGGVERIGTDDAILAYEADGCQKKREVKSVADHTVAIQNIVSLLLSKECGVIKDKSEIKGIGHRVVHGGEEFSDSVLIDSNVMDCIRKFSTFAPLHNPANLRGIEVCAELLPNIPQVAVFDTAFHHKMPESSYVYPIPYEYYIENGVRRYGFHGTSHKFVSNRAAELIGKPLAELKIITCHLGNGCSIAAIDKGISVDTTMGFTPLEGLVMGTRSGDIDPAIIFYLMEKLGLSSRDMENILNKKSGLLGISGTSNDMREVTAEADKGSKRHKLAIDIFCHRVRKYIGAYSAVMGGVDAVVFTGGIGENGPHIRRKVCSNMEFFGITIDESLNEKRNEIISTGKTKVMVISTNEELTIARDARALIANRDSECEKIKIPKSFLALFFGLVLNLFAQGDYLQIDHNCREINAIPTAWIDSAKAKLHIAYNHTSHGSQLITGMNALENYPPFGIRFAWSETEQANSLDLDDNGITNSIADLSQGDSEDANGKTPWYYGVKNFLQNSANRHINVIMYSWCSINGHNASRYLRNMDSLVALFPNVKFIYMTGHAERQGESVTTNNVHYNNQLIRNHCSAKGRILFDFADIEAYDPDGRYFWNLAMQDNLSYTGGNWGSEWIAENTNDTLSLITMGSGSYGGCRGCAHSDSPTQANINCVLKSVAAWWMYARLAGWNGSPSSILKNNPFDNNSVEIIVSPNPFNKSILISFPNGTRLDSPIRLYDMLGHNIASINDHGKTALYWNASNNPAGVYLIKVIANGKTISKRVTLTGRN